MTVRVGINGFGRIGRNFFRAAKQRGADIDFVAVNDLGSLDQMAHLLKYDSVLGVLPNEIKATKNGISVDGDELRVLSERDPKNLPWGELGVDVVIESTGFFTKRDTAAYHLEAGAPLVIVSAPCDGADATFVYGGNHKDFDFKTQKVISNAVRDHGRDYWTGTVYTTNRRVWEHDEAFKERLRMMRCMAIDMETATIFAAGFANRIPSGALLLVSDQPMIPEGVKTEASDAKVSAEFVERHISIGIEALKLIRRHGKSVRHLRFDE